jgi:hypothetical protein
MGEHKAITDPAVRTAKRTARALIIEGWAITVGAEIQSLRGIFGS